MKTFFVSPININHVGKQYRLGLVSTRTLSHDLDRWWQTAVLHKEDPYLKIGETNDRSTFGNSEYVWALKDIDFKIEQGDVVGIKGRIQTSTYELEDGSKRKKTEIIAENVTFLSNKKDQRTFVRWSVPLR